MHSCSTRKVTSRLGQYMGSAHSMVPVSVWHIGRWLLLWSGQSDIREGRSQPEHFLNSLIFWICYFFFFFKAGALSFPSAHTDSGSSLSSDPLTLIRQVPGHPHYACLTSVVGWDIANTNRFMFHLSPLSIPFCQKSPIQVTENKSKKAHPEGGQSPW